MNSSKYQQRWACPTMHKYVVTLDFAKKLKEAGWNRRTSFCWYTDERMNGKWSLGCVEDELLMLQAPIPDELLEEFPRGSLSISIASDGYLLTLVSGEQLKEYRFADALAGLWILKNKKK